MTKAFSYLRVSGRSQVDGDGFERQELAICAYAKAHDIKIAKIYREEGVSGTKDLINRPAFVAMMEALHSDGVKLVLVESLGRFARDLMIQESILHDLKRNGFELISVQEPDLCGDDPSRKLMRQIMGAFHEYEKTMIALKLRGARLRMKAKTGRCEGRKPYGEYEGEVAILERMKSLRDTGMGFDRIAEVLNAEGHKPRTGERWWGKTINGILSRDAS
jgi:DNA invertase Pin-like site-specific DNA recombinase